MAVPAPSPFEQALADAGGLGAPDRLTARLRARLLDELAYGNGELDRNRSGYERPVTVAFAVDPAGGLALGVAPVDPAVRADPGTVSEREWLVAASVAGAIVHASVNPRSVAGELSLRAGALERWLVLALPVGPVGLDGVQELAAVAFDDLVAGVDRLRARAIAVPGALLAGAGDLRAPLGQAHPLRVAEAVARLGGNPADPNSVAEHEEAVLAALGDGRPIARPHAERDPSLRIARRILQRLAGMGKWGGYHTEMAHLARGFPGHERAAALEVGERLLAAGLLLEKPSVGQRHVYLNPRRAADVYALIERGELPPGLALGGR